MNIWDKIPRLARLKLTQEDQNLLLPQVEKIVDFFHNISTLPTDDTEPLVSPIESALPVREDHVQESDSHLLKQAPSQEDHYVKTPLVVSSNIKE